MQMFIYEMNQMYVARGGQTVFSSMNLEIEVPKYLKQHQLSIIIHKLAIPKGGAELTVVGHVCLLPI